MSSPQLPPGTHVPVLVGSLPGRQQSSQFLPPPPPPEDVAEANNHYRRPRPVMATGYGTSDAALPPTGQTGKLPHEALTEHSALLGHADTHGDLSAEEAGSTRRLLKELGSLSRLASPVVMAFLLQKSIDITSVFSLGHLGAQELAASALGTMFIAVTGWSVALGMATALDTLASQAYTASPDPRMLGIYLQRAILVLMLMAVPIAGLWWYADSVLVMLGQEPELSALSGLFIRWSMFSLVPYVGFECIKRYLQAQGIMHAGTYILMITSPLNVLTNYLLVWWPPISLGFIGAPIATSCTHWLNLLLGVLFVRYVDGSRCWGGWSREALRDWGPFIRLGLAGVAFVCGEWWAFEVVALAAGYLGTVPLAAQSIILTTASFTYMIPAGVSIAACNRIGNELGLRHANRAKLAAYSALLLALIISTFNTTFLILLKDRWGYLFNSDPEVVALVGTLLPIAALFQVGDVFGGVGGGILRGIGQQHIGAYLTIVSYYFISLPLGLYLTFSLDMGLAGLWWGLCLALFIVAIGEVRVIMRADWQEEVERCATRISGDASATVYDEEAYIA
ncbi:mate-domain-containing protein [Thamnocephalis sphaerospora]|uniref:Mate-domain-containing protein n=1 Tax=Thamnocephalis sphaerospora TaxID=78915 RepID=A0A4P9XVJ2_9FUNG|nr:mate-domain-containing protein [Thamnocephalis sphaerospora]|eukprot:RKP10297.1 mate-domain-containing protein [Thamnocephalis sphaerospora]